MAHYAYINDNNVVTSVIVGPDEGTEPEGISSWEEYFSAKGKGQAVRTSYNTRGGVHLSGGQPLRYNYAAKGYTYDSQADAFIPPKPYESWILNESTFLWDPPTPHPEDGTPYRWDEASTSWVAAS